MAQVFFTDQVAHQADLALELLIVYLADYLLKLLLSFDLVSDQVLFDVHDVQEQVFLILVDVLCFFEFDKENAVQIDLMLES